MIAGSSLRDLSGDVLEIESGNVNGNPAGSGTVGERIFQFEAGMLTFTAEAAPVTPEKPQ